MSETLEENGKYRVRLVLDEYADEPYDDGQSPLLRMEYRYGWHAEHVMATGRPTDDDSRIEEAAQRWGAPYGDDWRCFEKYLRAFYGTREIETWQSQDGIYYITYDTAKWREYIGFEEGAETPRPLVNMSEWRAYVEGDCWYWITEKLVTWHAVNPVTDDPDYAEYPDRDTWETVDSCGGYYGSEYAEECAREAYAELVKDDTLTPERLAAAIADMERVSRNLREDREKGK